MTPRRHVLALLLPCLARAQGRDLPLASPVDAVAIYVIPTDDVGEQAAGAIARLLTKETGLWVKSTMWAPSDVSEPFSGTNQYPAEDYFAMSSRISKTLKDASPRTYFVVITDRDINSKARNFRFQYSLHNPMANTSVLSLARLRYNTDGTAAPSDVVATRLAKMLLRIAGEMRLGWKRSSEPTDLMYAPIMSTDDIDRMDLMHTIKARKPQ